MIKCDVCNEITNRNKCNINYNYENIWEKNIIICNYCYKYLHFKKCVNCKKFISNDD